MIRGSFPYCIFLSGKMQRQQLLVVLKFKTKFVSSAFFGISERFSINYQFLIYCCLCVFLWFLCDEKKGHWVMNIETNHQNGLTVQPYQTRHSRILQSAPRHFWCTFLALAFHYVSLDFISVQHNFVIRQSTWQDMPVLSRVIGLEAVLGNVRVLLKEKDDNKECNALREKNLPNSSSVHFRL